MKPDKILSILISTKNRKIDLGITLQKTQYLFERNDVECVVFDDGSTDGTFEYVRHDFPEIIIHRNEISKGYMFCRNKMLNETKADFAISLDDDAHFLTQNPLEKITAYFDKNTNCGLVAFRIFWGLDEPNSIFSNEKSHRVQSFVGCGHAWRMVAWRNIPNYPEWFQFYGEEDFASFQLFKKNWEIHYLPEVLINHRADIKSRKSHKNYSLRLRHSLRSGWYLCLLFFPIHTIPKKMVYSIWMQLRLKVFKGDYKALLVIFGALFDLIFHFPKVVLNRNKLSNGEYKAFLKLEETKIYWEPEN